MFLTGLRYNALKKSRRFVTHSFNDVAKENSAPVWLEANHISGNKWQVMEHTYSYSPAYKRVGLTGKLVESDIDFKIAAEILSCFEDRAEEQSLVPEHNDATDGFMHVSEVQKIISDQKYSLRQKLFGPHF